MGVSAMTMNYINPTYASATDFKRANEKMCQQKVFKDQKQYRLSVICVPKDIKLLAIQSNIPHGTRMGSIR